MAKDLLGLHHITAVSSDAKKTLDFYTRVLGLRLVKKTVNFDDPGTYHFYFGDEVGTPGTILTFFPHTGLTRGRAGVGMATEIGYAVPKESLEGWSQRLTDFKVKHSEIEDNFGEASIQLEDNDGLRLRLIGSSSDTRKPFTGNGTDAANATRGFHTVLLEVRQAQATAAVLTDIFGYSLQNTDGKRYRYATDAVSEAAFVDIAESADGIRGLGGAGTNHHVAFRVRDEDTLMAYREKVLSKGLQITPKINRDYFFSLYFREPNGILFEIATDNPGFTVDEPLEELGKGLKLPKQHESLRAQLASILPKLD